MVFYREEKCGFFQGDIINERSSMKIKWGNQLIFEKADFKIKLDVPAQKLSELNN